MPKQAFIEKAHEHLFDSSSEISEVFNEEEQKILIRIKDLFTKMLDESFLPDSVLVQYMIDTYQIDKSTAYRDIQRTNVLLGNVKNAAKEFQRYRANQMVMHGFDEIKNAKKQLDVLRGSSMIRAGEALVKINKLDKTEEESIPWGKIVPVELQSTDDVSIIPGHKRKFKDRDELIAYQNKTRKKFGSEPVDTPFELVTEDEENDD